MASPLDTELAFFNAHLAEWLTIHPGKFILVKGNELLGAYDNAETAYAAGVKRLGNSPMLIRQVLAEQPKHSAPALMHGLL